MRREYTDTQLGPSPVRTEISCFTGDDPLSGHALGDTNPNTTKPCGYLQDSSTVNAYIIQQGTRQYGKVVWYGKNPTGTGGGSCSGTVLCSSSMSSSYNEVARRYATITQTSNINGSPLHTSTTNWTRTPGITSWLLGLYDRQTDTETGPSKTRYLYFDSTTGFLKGSTLAEVVGSTYRSFITCRFADSAGNAHNEVSLIANPGPSDPTANPCPSSVSAFSTIGASQDLFGRQSDFQTALPTSAYWMTTPAGGVTFFSFLVSRENATGAISKSFEAASQQSTGQETDYSYDSLGRLMGITPKADTPPKAAGVDDPMAIVYDNPNQTTVTRADTTEQYRYDGLGRLTREIRKLPTGSLNAFAVRATTYDSAGHASFVSEWTGCTDLAACGTVGVTKGTTSSAFDPFGRPQTVTRADASTSSVDFGDGGALFSDTQKKITVTENGSCAPTCGGGTLSTTTYNYDAYGRLINVTEPLVTGQNASDADVTTYTYDVNGKLTSVTQPARVTGTLVATQTRTFTYDIAGNLRTEITPERGTITYLDDPGVLAYGSLGNLIREKDSDGLIRSHCYDFAGRLATVRTNEDGSSAYCPFTGTGASGRLYVQSTYDGAAGDRPLGKLTQRIGYNASAPNAPTVTEAFTYSGRNGRLSQKDISLSATPVGVFSVRQQWTYSTLGSPDTYTLPRRVGTDSDVVETITYSAGSPTGLSVTAPTSQTVVSGVKYHPYGGLNEFVEGSGLKTTIGMDLTTLLPRPSSIQLGLTCPPKTGPV